MSVSPIPKGFHTLTPYLRVRDAARAIDFYTRAFGAQEMFRMPAPDGKIIHADLRLGDSHIMLSEEFPGMGFPGPETVGGTTITLHVYCEDVDAFVARAQAAGATVVRPPEDQFWGDRMASLRDPFGHDWGIATRREDLSGDEVMRRGQEAMSKKSC